MSTLKPKVVFTYVEAGLGHIMPMTGMQKAFEEKYGDKCEIVTMYPFSQSKHPEVVAMGNELSAHTKSTAKCFLYRWFEGVSYKFPSKLVLKFLDMHFGKKRKLYLEEVKDLKPDLLVASYYLPSHLASQSRKAGEWDCVIANYFPDYCTYPAWDRDCELVLVHNQRAKDESEKKGFGGKVVKVPYIFKQGVLGLNKSKEEAKKELGLDNGKPTVIYANGAYGSNATVKCVKKILESNLDINLIACCGKNQRVFDSLTQLKNEIKSSCQLTVLGFVDNLSDYMRAGDLCVGKASPTTIEESLYLGTPFVINAITNKVEYFSQQHYLKEGLAVKGYKNKEVISAIKKLVADRSCYDYTVKNYEEKFKSSEGAERSADELYKLLKNKITQPSGEKNQ